MGHDCVDSPRFHHTVPSRRGAREAGWTSSTARFIRQPVGVFRRDSHGLRKTPASCLARGARGPPPSEQGAQWTTAPGGMGMGPVGS
ncbi:Hypothetical protein AA314_09810 [Archangium gephyra]|uniref:Uncharacterized protein n=1 Tax=Archangium gephyra TaxID=48 RepID=A0AAC8QIV8_9BACT|nr:Hypothetical protein AA314_09810 [Archangium gephyra]